jgi:hypothetical protein
MSINKDVKKETYKNIVRGTRVVRVRRELGIRIWIILPTSQASFPLLCLSSPNKITGDSYSTHIRISKYVPLYRYAFKELGAQESFFVF